MRLFTHRRLCWFFPVLLAGLLACVPEAQRQKPVPVVPDPPPIDQPDSILTVEVPGAYGVQGGTLVFDGHRLQTSILQYGAVQSVRVMDPDNLTVVSFSGLPRPLEEGEEVSFLYRVAQKGIVTVSRRYSGIAVLQVKDGLAWLKQDDDCYFVIEQ